MTVCVLDQAWKITVEQLTWMSKNFILVFKMLTASDGIQQYSF